jgi:hypothetical protein
MPPEQIHHGTPRYRCEDRPGKPADCCTSARLRNNGKAVIRLDGHSGQREHHTREDVDDNLLVDGGDLPRPFRPTAKNKIPTQEASDEGVVWAYAGY